MAKSSVKPLGYKGWEIWIQVLKMNIKMCGEILLLCMALQLVVFAALLYFWMPPMDFELFWKMSVATFARHLLMNPTFHVFGEPILASKLLVIELARKMAARAIPELISFGFLSAATYIIYPFMVAWFVKQAKAATNVEHIRGMELTTEEELIREAKEKERKHGNGIIHFGKIPWPRKFEVTHAMVAASTGQGKTVFLEQALDAVRVAGFPAVVFDLKGEYTQKFYRPGIDHLANPLDSRGMAWNMFDDFKSIVDIFALCDSLIPPEDGENQFWSTAACAVLRGIICALYRKGPDFRNHAALWKALTAPPEEMAVMCKSCPEGAAALSYIDGDPKLASNTKASLIRYTQWLEFAQSGSGFSLNAWIEKPGDSCLFITGLATLATTLKPYNSLLIDLLGKKLLTLPNSDERRVYFILDELGNANRLPTLIPLMTAGRSKGASILLGFQDYAALEHIYLREGARTIMANCATTFCMKSTDKETAVVFTDRFHKAEYMTSTENISYGTEDTKGGQTLMRQQRLEDVILPGEIMMLPVLTGYFLMPECKPAKIELQITDANRKPIINEPYIPKAGLSVEEVMAAQAAIEAEMNLEEHGKRCSQRSVEKPEPAIEGEPEISSGVAAQIIDDSFSF